MTVRRATMKDVARASGVSPATVSFVLNDTPGQTIPADTRDRVRAAAAALGYRPHGIARALREGRSRVVVLGIGRLRGGRSLAEFIEGMREELRAHDYGLLVYPGSSGDLDHDDLIRDLHPRATLDLARTYAAPFGDDDGGWSDGLAAHTLVQIAHLADRGHREIAFAVPAEPDSDGLATLRADLASAAADRLGLPRMTILRVRDSPVPVRAALDELRRSHPAVTAVAGFDDEVALRVLGALSDLGLTAPGDLAVIGFDDSRVGASWRPALTSVRIDGRRFGRRAARSILGLDTEDAAGPAATVVLRHTT